MNISCLYYNNTYELYKFVQNYRLYIISQRVRVHDNPPLALLYILLKNYFVILSMLSFKYIIILIIVCIRYTAKLYRLAEYRVRRLPFGLVDHRK